MWTQSSLDMEPIVSQGWLSWTSFSLALAVTSEPSVFVFWPRPYFKWSLLRCPPQTIKVCDLIAANIVVSKSISVASKATLTFIGVYTTIVSVSVSIWHVANMPCGHKHFKYGQNSQKVKKAVDKPRGLYGLQKVHDSNPLEKQIKVLLQHSSEESML